MILDKELLRVYRIRRLQRAAEYLFLFAIFFFLLAFREYYRVWLAIVLAVLFFGMNVQLTIQRERRRMRRAKNRKRIVADMAESVLFLVLILLMSIPSVSTTIFGGTPQEHHGLMASILCGIFLAGLTTEVWFQLRRLPNFCEESRIQYVRNLKRSIIFPYFSSSKKRETEDRAHEDS